MADATAQASASQYANGVAQIRTAATWLIGAFGALGAALIAGVQLKNLSDVSGTPLAETIVSIAVGLLGVVIAIWSTSNVLIPIAASSRALEHTDEFGPLRAAVSGDPSMLRGLARDLSALLAELPTSLAAAKEAYNEMAEHPEDQGLRNAYAAAEDHRQQVESAVTELTSFGLFLAIRKRFVRARAMMFLGAALAATGATGFVHFAQAKPIPAKPKPAVHEPAPHHETLALVAVHLTARGRRSLHGKLGPHCQLRRLTAVVTSKVQRSPTVVILPRNGCRPVRVKLTGKLGSLSQP